MAAKKSGASYGDSRVSGRVTQASSRTKYVSQCAMSVHVEPSRLETDLNCPKMNRPLNQMGQGAVTP